MKSSVFPKVENKATITLNYLVFIVRQLGRATWSVILIALQSVLPSVRTSHTGTAVATAQPIIINTTE